MYVVEATVTVTVHFVPFLTPGVQVPLPLPLALALDLDLTNRPLRDCVTVTVTRAALESVRSSVVPAFAANRFFANRTPPTDGLPTPVAPVGPTGAPTTAVGADTAATDEPPRLVATTDTRTE